MSSSMVSCDSHLPQRRSSPGFIGPPHGVMVIGHTSTQAKQRLQNSGCTLCQKCYTGKSSWGICTQDPELTRRIDPVVGARRIANLVNAWSAEFEEILGALGLNAVESLRGSRERLRGPNLEQSTLDVLGVKPAGVGA